MVTPTRDLLRLFVLYSFISFACSSLWPLPQQVESSSVQYELIPTVFQFKATGYNSQILDSAFTRYLAIINSLTDSPPQSESVHAPIDTLLGLEVNVLTPNETLNENTIENYTLEITTPYASLVAPTVYGALRGLETFSQLVESSTSKILLINQTNITDFPRFQYRGILIDTSRHYLELDLILQHLDAMAYNKMNVLHWHIVDSQSFPYDSLVYPLLSEKGSWVPNSLSHVYTPSQVQTVISYAHQRGIRVIPEFDTPGHTLSWGKGYPYLLTTCYSIKLDGRVQESLGPINPTLNSTYAFMAAFFAEIARVFPDEFVHIGGDEVPHSCWASNPQVEKWMLENDVRNFSELEQYYVRNILAIVAGLNKKSMVWQDVIDNGVQVLNDTVVEVWEGTWEVEVLKVTALGLRTVLAQPWYLNYISYGSDWITYYAVDPTQFNGSAEQTALMFGGEACLWGEYIDGTNFIPTLWPRASAVAERLWSNENVTNVTDATIRINDLQCRLISRRINAQPVNGPSFCAEEWEPGYKPLW